MTEQKTKINMALLHGAVMLVLIIGAHFISPISTVTPVGMQLVGIFLAMLYGWSTCGLLWPSLLGIIGIALSDICTIKEFLALSFGNETIVFILFVFIFTGVISEVGLIDYIANKMISFKFLNGRPWLFSFFILLGTYIASGFVNMFAAVIIFWGIIYIVAERFGFEKYDRYPTVMIMGVCFTSLIGGCLMPYKPVTLVVLKAYSQAAGVPMDFLKYICFSVPITLLVLVFYILACRFVLRTDIKALKQINVDFADPTLLTLTKKQKVAVGLLGIFIFLMVSPNLLPETFFLARLINKLGNVGCLFGLLVVMHWIKFNGEPMADFAKLGKHISWDIYLVMAFVIPFASLFTSEVTGIKTFIIALMKPLLVGRSELVFMVISLALATILTNFANNMVVGAIFATLIVTIGGGMGIDVAPVIAVLCICINLAMVTPAASPAAAMAFANTNWCKAADVYKYSIVLVIVILVLLIPIGLFWASIIY